MTQALRPLIMVQNLGPTCIWSDSNPLGSSGTPASHDSSQSHSTRPTGFQFLKLMGNKIRQSTEGYVARLKGPERSKTVLAMMRMLRLWFEAKIKNASQTFGHTHIKSIDLRATLLYSSQKSDPKCHASKNCSDCSDHDSAPGGSSKVADTKRA